MEKEFCFSVWRELQLWWVLGEAWTEMWTLGTADSTVQSEMAAAAVDSESYVMDGWWRRFCGGTVWREADLIRGEGWDCDISMFREVRGWWPGSRAMERGCSEGQVQCFIWLGRGSRTQNELELVSLMVVTTIDMWREKLLIKISDSKVGTSGVTAVNNTINESHNAKW